MEKWLKDCGLSEAVEIFSENCIELHQLDELTEAEIKEMLPKIGDRHKLKAAIKKKPKFTEDQYPRQEKRMRMRTMANSAISSEAESDRCTIKKFLKNDTEKKEAIINILNTDKILTAELTELARNIFEEHSPFLLAENCRTMPRWKLINYENGSLNCPLREKTITPQFRRGSLKTTWQISNLKRHLNFKHKNVGPPEVHTDDEADVESGDGNELVNSILEIGMKESTASPADADAVEADVESVDGNGIASNSISEIGMEVSTASPADADAVEADVESVDGNGIASNSISEIGMEVSTSSVMNTKGRNAAQHSCTPIITRKQAQELASRQKLNEYLQTLQFGWLKFKKHEKFLPAFVHSMDEDGKTRAQWLTLQGTLSDLKLEFLKFEENVSENLKPASYVRALQKLNKNAGTWYE